MYDQKKVYEAPTLGNQDRLSPVTCNDKEAPVLENFEVNYRGTLDKYKGYTKDGAPFPDSTDSFLRMLVNYKKSSTYDVLVMAAQDNTNTNASYKVDLKYTPGDGTYAYIGHTSTGTSPAQTATFTNANTAVTGSNTAWFSHLKAGDKIKALSHTDAMYTEIASVNSNTSLTLVAGGYLGASLATTDFTARIILSKFGIPFAVPFNSKLVITNGYETPMTFDGTTVKRITDADCPKGKYIEAHKNRVFMANVSAGQSNIYWSAVTDESTWDAASYEQIFPQDGDEICAIKSFADSLVVFKAKGSIYQVFGNLDDSDVGTVDTIRKVDTTQNLGNILGRSVVVHNNYLYFFTTSGFYRMDYRGWVEKVSYQINNFTDSIYTNSTTSQSKFYLYDTKTQWDLGVYKDADVASSPITTKCSTDGTLSTFADTYKHSDSDVNGPDKMSIFMEADGTIHYVYFDPHTTTNGLEYVKKTPAGVETKETIVGAGGGSYSRPRVTVNTSGDVFIMLEDPAHSYKPYINEKLSGGSWSGWSTPAICSGKAFSSSHVCIYSPSSPTTVYMVYKSGTGSGGDCYVRISGTWYSFPVAHNSGGWVDFTDIMFDASGYLWVVGEESGSEVSYTRSLDGGATWAGAKTGYYAASGHDSGPSIAETNAGVKYAIYHGTTTATGIYSCNLPATFTDAKVQTLLGTGVIFYGGTISKWNDKFIFVVSNEVVNTPATEIVYYDTTSSITNPDTLSLVPYFTQRKCFSSNGGIISYIIPGANAGEIIIQRIAPTAVYTTNENHDLTLTSWQTFDVGNQADNGATVVHKIAVNNASPASSYATKTNGSLISNDPTMIYVRYKCTITLSTFATPTIGSVSLNYLGAGVDSRQPMGISFNNELYHAVCTGVSGVNNKVSIIDLANKFIRTTYPVSVMEWYKNKLYAGHASKGDLLVLKQGYSHAGTAYTSECDFKEDFLGSIELEKDIGKCYILYEVQPQGSMTLSYRIDNFKYPSGATWVDTTVDVTGTGFQELVIGKKARTIQFKVTDSTLDSSSVVFAIILTYRYLNLR